MVQNRQLLLLIQKKKGVVVGKEGRNAEKARLLARRYFHISNVLILSPEQTTNDNNGVNM
jgi:N utilization substance protein A